MTIETDSSPLYHCLCWSADVLRDIRTTNIWGIHARAVTEIVTKEEETSVPIFFTFLRDLYPFFSSQILKAYVISSRYMHHVYIYHVYFWNWFGILTFVPASRFGVWTNRHRSKLKVNLLRASGAIQGTKHSSLGGINLRQDRLLLTDPDYN